MTRGKHSTAASARRISALEEKVDQLETLVAVHQANARRAEKEAEAVPALMAKVTDLSRHVEEGSSARVEDLEARLAGADEGRRADLLSLARVMKNAFDRSGIEPSFTTSEIGEVLGLLGSDVAEVLPGVARNRTARRNVAYFEGKPNKAKSHLNRAAGTDR